MSDVNYTPEMEKAIKAAAPFDLDGAKALGKELGKGYRSIIAKCKSMKLDYTVKVAPTKRIAKVTKVQLVEEISKNCKVDLEGLEKSTVASLVLLRDAVCGMDHI